VLVGDDRGLAVDPLRTMHLRVRESSFSRATTASGGWSARLRGHGASLPVWGIRSRICLCRLVLIRCVWARWPCLCVSPRTCAIWWACIKTPEDGLRLT